MSPMDVFAGFESEVNRLLNEVESVRNQKIKYVEGNRALVKSIMPKKGKIYKLINTPDDDDGFSSSAAKPGVYIKITKDALYAIKRHSRYDMYPTVEGLILDESFNPVIHTGLTREVALEPRVSIKFIGEQVTTPSGGRSASNFVYLINVVDTDLFKIGITNDVQKRFSSIKTSCPFELRIHKQYPCPSAIARERELHERFRGQRTQGEWFKLSDYDLTYIDNSLCKT